MKISEKIDRTPHIVRYIVVFDNESEADAFVEDVTTNYHPAGYGTTLEVNEDDEGLFTVTGWRGTSCE